MKTTKAHLLSRALGYSLFIVILLGGSATTVQAAEEPSPQDSISVIAGKTQDLVVNFAVHELQRYLERMTGGNVGIGNASASHRLYVSEMPAGIPATEAQQLRSSLNALAEDSFIIRSVGPDIMLLGKGDRGNLYACYAFLERLGVRWYFPGSQNEVVPHAAINWHEAYNISQSPAFRKRILFYWPNNYTRAEEWIDYAAKLRLNCIMFHYTWPSWDRINCNKHRPGRRPRRPAWNRRQMRP